MKKFAVIKLGSRQYIVEEGKDYSVPKFNVEKGKQVISDVLAAGDDKDFKLGTPKIDKAEVVLEVIDHVKGEKVKTNVYKAKSRYRKSRGHRKLLTKFKVKKITF
jgi:large subunit ribosomal protein L21